MFVTLFGDLFFREPEICFPVAESLPLLTSANVVEVEKQIEEKKSMMMNINICIEKLTKNHRRSLKRFKKAKKSAHKLLETIRSRQEESSSPVKEGGQLLEANSSQSL